MTNQYQDNKPELLSPAGNMECFFAAVENGADAVYFGLEHFSARAGAMNFTLEDASKAIAYAHQKSIKVYIAFNTLIKTHELERAVNYLLDLYELQPDAIIIQDLGLLHLIQTHFPQFELHASTQMAVHNLAGARQLKAMGFKRVVPARELSISEIHEITRNVPIEIEVFVHGAMCYSFSGLCFFSSMMGGRSGNRGKCAQPCRLNYKTCSGETGYLFSMKDLQSLSHVDMLMDKGIRSFKIEGRMKSPVYVAMVTNAYRKAIDGNLHDSAETIHQIKTVFSRETSHAFLFGKNYSQAPKKETNVPIKPGDVINPLYPANIGVYAGEVVSSMEKSLAIRASVEIGVRDLLQVFETSGEKPTLLYVKEMKVNDQRVYHINAGQVAVIRTDQRYKRGTKLYLLSSQKIKEKFAVKIPKKPEPAQMPVNIDIYIYSEGIKVTGTVMHFSFSKEYSMKLETGIHRSIEDETIKKCFSRLGKTQFELTNIHTNISEKLFIPLSVLNEIRRDYFHNLSEAWLKDKRCRSENINNWIRQKGNKSDSTHQELSTKNISEETYKLSLKIDNPEYLNHIPLEKLHNLYIALTVNGDDLFSCDLLCRQSESQTPKEKSIVDQLLHIKEKVVFSLPVIIRDIRKEGVHEHVRVCIRKLIALGFKQFQISNPGTMDLFKDEDVVLFADYPLYALNTLSGLKLMELGFCKYTLSPEDDHNNQQTLCAKEAEIIIYQNTPLFLSEVCVWANMNGACPGLQKCNFKQFEMENEYGDRFIAINDQCKTIIVGAKPFSIIHFVPQFLKEGQNNFRVDLCYKKFTPEMIQYLFLKIQTWSTVENTTIGNFKRGLL